jgi:2-dehydropantoate 2-reductase
MAKSYAILGTGALGGYYGGLLAKAGIDVHFLARSDASHIRRYGLRVDSKDGDFVVASPQVYARAADMPACDVAVVAMKTTENRHLSELLPAVLKPEGYALVLQNGLCPEADAANVLGPDRVLGGCCFLCSNKVGPGHIRHLDFGPISLGEYRPAKPLVVGMTDRLEAVAVDLRTAGIAATAVDDLWRARFTKLVWNVPFNGLSVVLGSTTDRLVEDAEPLVRSLMAEVASVAAGWGRPLEGHVIDKMIENTRKMIPYDSSMLIDWKQGRPMEIDAIFGGLVRAAATVGVKVPGMETIYRQLQFLELQKSGFSKEKFPTNPPPLAEKTRS